MALSEDQVAKIIRGFIAELSREIPIKAIILFGSYAQGNPKEYSDIDLAVISDWFKGKPRIENMQYLLLSPVKKYTEVAGEKVTGLM